MKTDLNTINLETEDGKMLLAAIAKISTESQTNKTPNQIISQLNKLKNHMFTDQTNINK